MLFRTNKGDLIELKKYDYYNDNLYYEKIMEIKKKSAKIEKFHNSSNNTLKRKKNQ